ncbi:hypothetical protein J6590_078863 [Homalodisca vitripennis]|nr:hypothetical protein J6590_078863 [Homalodisca vitripennis]
MSHAKPELLTNFGWTNCAPSPLQPTPNPQEHLGGQRFSTDDEVKEEVTRFLKGLAAEFYNMGIEKLEHLLQKCLDRNDVYMTTVGVSAHATMLDVSPVYGSVTTVFSVTFTSTLLDLSDGRSNPMDRQATLSTYRRLIEITFVPPPRVIALSNAQEIGIFQCWNELL